MIYFYGFINLEFDFLFREWAVLKFLGSAYFLKFLPNTKQFDAPKHHNFDFFFLWNCVIS